MDAKNENLINILGIEALPLEQRARIIDQASELVEKRLMARILESMTKEKHEQFLKILESGKEESIAQFIDENCPDYATWLGEEMLRVKEELSTLAKKD